MRLLGAVMTTDPIPIAVASAPQVTLRVVEGSDKKVDVGCRRLVTTIGSQSSCKIVLPHRKVSAQHVAIINNGEQVYAVDLLSKLGTHLNGLKMEHEQLTDGDMLQVGRWVFRVDITEPLDRDVDSGVHQFGLEPVPLVVAFEHIESKRILQPNRNVCLIGRREGCDIHIDDRRVSRVHALLMRFYGRPAVVDLFSHNGTLVNDESTMFKILEDQDILQIGDARFRVRLIDSHFDMKSQNASPASAKPQTKARKNDKIDLESTAD